MVMANTKTVVNLVESGAPTDFDFEIGSWRVKHRKLSDVMNDDSEWIEFEGRSSVIKTMGGYGNIEDNIIEFPEGVVRALAIRSFKKETNQWSIWWLDGRVPDSVGVPVVGHFEGDIGLFYADEIIQGTPVKVRFIWDVTNRHEPRWEQAFSRDEGISWSINWTMEFTKLDK